MRSKTILLIIFAFAGCINPKNKEKLFGVKPVCNGLFREKFRVFSGGAYSAELYSDYLTDSLNFRQFIGIHDEHENIDYLCEGDLITVKKFTFQGQKKSKILAQWKFSLSTLIKNHVFK